MFREMVRKKQQLGDAECIELLRKTKRGVLSVLGDDGYPYGMPLNHFYNDEDGKIYFHSGPVGHKIDAIKSCDKVSFCVYDEGFRKEGSWALNIKSVIVFGRVEIIEDKDEIFRISRLLSYKFTDDEEYIENEINRVGARTFMFRIVPEHMTGKLVNES